MAEVNDGTREISVDNFNRILASVGYDHCNVDRENQSVTLDIQGDVTVIRLIVRVGSTGSGQAWYTHFISYSLEFEPKKAGVGREVLLDWLNKKNADVIFGRYYYHEESDTVVFESSIPCNTGLAEEDFLDMLRIATLTVDKSHAELKSLAAN